MAYNSQSNAARKVEYVYENKTNRLVRYVSKEEVSKAEERRANKIVLKLAALVLSVGILSGIYVYSCAAIYSTQTQISALEETLEFNQSYYTQTLTAYNNKFTQDFVISYAVNNLDFAENSNSVVYITSEESVEVYK